MISKSNIKFTDSEVRTASRLASWTQQEIEKLLEDKDSMIFKCLKISCHRCDNAFVVIFFKAMYNKTIIKFGFRDIRYNQDLGQCYQPQPSDLVDNTCLDDLDYFGYHKTSSNNCSESVGL